MSQPRVVSFINYKGGVGKTTTTYHIGCSLAEHHGKRVLLVDIDPQSNLSLLCMAYEKYDEFRRQQGTIRDLYRRFRENRSPLDVRDFIVRNAVQGGGDPIEGVDLLPCDIDLLGEDLGGLVPTVSAARAASGYEVLRQLAQKLLNEWTFLHRVCEEIGDSYDFILIDCPPNLYMMTQNAIRASHYYMVTLIPEFLSAIGLDILVRKIDDIRKKISQVGALAGYDSVPMAALGGIIWVKKRNTKQHERTIERLREHKIFGPFVFDWGTTERTGYSEAAEAQCPIWRVKTPSAQEAARLGEYERITEEFLKRCQ